MPERVCVWGGGVNKKCPIVCHHHFKGFDATRKMTIRQLTTIVAITVTNKLLLLFFKSSQIRGATS